MAAIDKLYTKYYSDARNLVVWLSIKRPSMLENLYDWTFSEQEFNSIKEERYLVRKLSQKRLNKRWISQPAISLTVEPQICSLLRM